MARVAVAPHSIWIVSSPALAGGKPCVRGTRMTVEFILELLACGATYEELLRAYPELTIDGLTAALQYAARAVAAPPQYTARAVA